MEHSARRTLKRRAAKTRSGPGRSRAPPSPRAVLAVVPPQPSASQAAAWRSGRLHSVTGLAHQRLGCASSLPLAGPALGRRLAAQSPLLVAAGTGGRGSLLLPSWASSTAVTSERSRPVAVVLAQQLHVQALAAAVVVAHLRAQLSPPSPPSPRPSVAARFAATAPHLRPGRQVSAVVRWLVYLSQLRPPSPRSTHPARAPSRKSSK